MTDEPDSSDEADDPASPDSVPWGRPDGALALFQDLANNAGVGFGVTLTISGQLITGRMIPGRIYFEKLADSVAADTTPDLTLRDTLSGLFTELGSGYKDLNDPDAPDQPDRPVHYVHLEDAWLVSGEAWTNLGLWRGRLTMVDGWTFGTLRDRT